MLLTTTFGYAQKNWQRIQSLKVAHITDAIALTPEEATNFWPIYNKYEDDIRSNEKQMRQAMRDVSDEGILSKISEAEANEMLAKKISQQEAILKLKIDRVNELKKVVSAKKILKLQQAERGFRRSLLKEYRKRRMN